jgi:hypothetical protein
MSTGIAPALSTPDGGTADGIDVASRGRTRAMRTKAITGTSEPNAPSGSRRKILISSHVSAQSPRMAIASVPDEMTGELEEHVLERRQHGPEIRDAHAVFGQGTDDLAHELLTLAMQRIARAVPIHR